MGTQEQLKEKIAENQIRALRDRIAVLETELVSQPIEALRHMQALLNVLQEHNIEDRRADDAIKFLTNKRLKGEFVPIK